jgi:uncharacterized membrane protein
LIAVTISTEIALPAELVFAYVADFSNNAAWQSGIASVTWTTPPPIQVGSTYDQVTDHKQGVSSHEITAIEPGRSITTESREGAAIPVTVTRTVNPLNDTRCRVIVDLAAHPKAVRRLTKPLLRRVVRRSVASDYRRLKRLLEKDQAEGADEDT